MAISFAFLERWAFELALRPLGDRPMIFLGLGEAFTTHLGFALALGFILALPIVAYQIWAFVAPGLYPNERRAAQKLALASTVLFALGAAFSYFILLPIIVIFFLSYEVGNLQYAGAIGPYLKLFSGILIGGGIAFQFPLILLAGMKSGLITSEKISGKRGYWILGIVIASALLTPTGDVVTQLVLAAPLWLLFEVAILYGRLTRI